MSLKKDFIEALVNRFGGESVSRKQIESELGHIYKNWYNNLRSCFSSHSDGKGNYNIPKTYDMVTSTKQKHVNIHKTKPTSNLEPEILGTDVAETSFGVIPENDPLFVPFGFHTSLKKILNKEIFYPIFITGLSGNGKTKSVQQACAEIGRKLFKVSITIETDEDDLIGGFRLKDGNTVYEYGPVINAMKEGAVLLLDECDLASSKIMCLQSVLEGGAYYIKKTGETVSPAHGFTIVATANTKGRGSADGRFIGTNILNEAFLERFVITVEQEYPSESVEKKMLVKLFDKFGIDDEDFADKLVKWAKVIRDGFFNGSIDEIITTRRLVHIAKTYSIFENKLESIKLCLARFDDESKIAFLDSYSALDASVNKTEVPEVQDPQNVIVTPF